MGERIAGFPLRVKRRAVCRCLSFLSDISDPNRRAPQRVSENSLFAALRNARESLPYSPRSVPRESRTMSTAMSAGETPDILLAWPEVEGTYPVQLLPGFQPQRGDREIVDVGRQELLFEAALFFDRLFLFFEIALVFELHDCGGQRLARTTRRAEIPRRPPP